MMEPHNSSAGLHLHSNTNNDTDSTNNSDPSGQLDMLLTSIAAVAQLAAMETNEYQTTILKNNNNNNNQDDHHLQCLQRSLAQVEQHYGLTDTTPLANLTHSIHRFHSKCALLQHEADQQAAEINSLQQLVRTLQKQNTRLETNVQALEEQNQKLGQELKTKSKQKKCLAHHVKGFLHKAKLAQEQEKELEHWKLAYKLQMHERYLQTAHNNRDRTASADSHFSDGLDFLHCSGDESEGSLAASSLITDDGVATLQLSPLSSTTMTSDPRERTFSDGSQLSVEERCRSPESYTLQFRRGSKVGVRIRALTVEPQGRRSKTSSILTPCFKPNADLTRAMLSTGEDDSNEQKQQQQKQQGQGPNHGHNPFSSLNFNMKQFSFNNNSNDNRDNHHDAKTDPAVNPQRRDTAQEKHEKAPTRHIFVVSGYCDFDTSENKQPPVGTRIVAINNVPVPDTFTLNELTDSLRANSEKELAEDDGTTYSVSFREDILSDKQKQELANHSETASPFDYIMPTATPGSSTATMEEKVIVASSSSVQNKSTGRGLDMKRMGLHFSGFKYGSNDATNTVGSVPSSAEVTNSSSSNKEAQSHLPAESTALRTSSRKAKAEHHNKSGIQAVFPFWKAKEDEKEDMEVCPSDDSLL